MLLGLVSNVWNVQLAAGEDLADLVAAAAARGYRVIELRQKSLGGYESERDHLPDVAGLAALARRFPELRFVAAYEVPFLHPDTGPHDRYFEAAVGVARAVAQERQPHVRLVDLSTTAEQLAAGGPGAAGHTIARLAAALGDDDTLLSVENAWQPWPLLAAAIYAARTALGTAAGRLRICFDPCNFAFIQEPTDAAAVLASLSPEQVGMLHFKQRRNGTPRSFGRRRRRRLAAPDTRDRQAPPVRPGVVRNGQPRATVAQPGTQQRLSAAPVAAHGHRRTLGLASGGRVPGGANSRR